MKTDLFKKNQALPRYTSYPTAPHFHSDINNEVYKDWLGQLDSDCTLSLYVHIPFCDTLCWFCGCHTKITKRYTPVSDYLDALNTEIQAVASHISSEPKVTHIHFGGGSPTILKPEDLKKIVDTFKSVFRFSDDLKFAVEIDPRGLTEEHIKILSACGVNRASIGVQDFNPDVQSAINRIQTFDETAHVVDLLRKYDISGINIDLLYGLPHQTLTTIEQTIHQVLSLQPDRISFFGYAHVPWMKKHQSLIDETALPQMEERLLQADHSSRILEESDYIRIGLDHFARPEDSLVTAQKNGTLKRNFQGYTTDNATAIIGLGASAIGKLPQGYIQNKTEIGRYQAEISDNGLAVARGLELSNDDKMRAFVIEQLMCGLNFSKNAVLKIFGELAKPVLQEADTLLEEEKKGYLIQTKDGFRITEKGRPYIRMFCAHFDKYLRLGKARHSAAV